VLPPPPQPPATSIGDISLLKPPLPPNNKPKPVNRTCMSVYDTPVMDQKVQHHLHKVSPPVIAVQPDQCSHTFPLQFLIISSSQLRLGTETSLRFRISNQNFVCVSHCPMRVTWLTHLILLDMTLLKYVTKSTNHKSSLCTLFSSL
jgi:hypothetical protein